MSQKSFEFVVYIIHACADKWGCSPPKCYNTLKNSGCLDFLVSYHDVLHTQSTAYIVNDVEEFLKAREIRV